MVPRRWEMPSSTRGSRRARAVRHRPGVFDVSHRGELDVEGPQARRCCSGRSRTTSEGGPGEASNAADERDGRILDDLIVYADGECRYLLIANAATRIGLSGSRARGPGIDVRDVSDEYGLLAVQDRVPRRWAFRRRRPLPGSKAKLDGVEVMITGRAHGEEGSSCVHGRRRPRALAGDRRAGVTPCGLARATRCGSKLLSAARKRHRPQWDRSRAARRACALESGFVGRPLRE